MTRAALALALVVAAACGPPVTEGRIVSLDWRDAWVEHYSYKCGSLPISSDFSLPVYCDGTRHHDARWWIVIEGDPDNDGKPNRATVHLPEHEWRDLRTGDYWIVGQGKVLR